MEILLHLKNHLVTLLQVVDTDEISFLLISLRNYSCKIQDPDRRSIKDFVLIKSDALSMILTYSKLVQ